MRTKANSTGFTLLEIMVSLAIIAIALVLINTLVTNSAERERESLAATHAKQVVDAAQRYISDNAATLISSATATTPSIVTVAMLKSANYLPAQFSNVNPYNQTYEIRVMEFTPNQLSALVDTLGGEVIGEGALRRIARQIGPEGGYISTSSATTATGAYSGWTVGLSSYGIAGSNASHIASALFFRDGQQVSDYIYRGAVPGKPELNQMTTDLDLGNNDLANANGVTANGAVQGATVHATGRTFADEYVLIGGVVTVGGACTPNGLLGREADGHLASCVTGVWHRAGF